MLNQQIIEEIEMIVRTGFHEKVEILSIVCEEMYYEEDLDENEVRNCINSEWEKWDKEKEDYPEVTDCDRLDECFDALEKRGLIALQKAGFTQSDGYEDFQEAYQRHSNQETVLGYCFYHGQDLIRAMLEGILFLAFGPANPDDEDTKGSEIGNIVREELERVGLKVEWNGTFDERMHIAGLNWQKR